MYDEENKNLSENPDMENETGADVRDTENAGAEGKDSTAAQPESGTTGSQYRYSGPFYQDTDYQRTESRNTESSFQGSVSKKQKKKKNFGRTLRRPCALRWYLAWWPERHSRARILWDRSCSAIR